ncbi:MAG TPA: hypothetical protein VIW69_05315 [Candidatus Elarobacter sp.]
MSTFHAPAETPLRALYHPANGPARNAEQSRARRFQAANDGISAAQQAFVQTVQSQVTPVIQSELDGTFQMAPYPAGFNYGIVYGNNGYFNAATLGDIDTLLQTSSSGNLELGSSGSFSSFYAQLLPAVTFNFSQADEQTMNKQDTAAAGQIASIITEFGNAGGQFTNPLPFGGKLQDIFNQLIKAYGSLANLPSTLNALRNAITAYQQMAGQSYALHNKFNAATTRLAAILANVTSPSATNGGLQTGAVSYYLSYGGPGGEKLPTVNQLLGYLNSPNRNATVEIDISSFDSSESYLSIASSAGLSIPVVDVFSVGIGGSSTYTLDRYATSSSSLHVTMEYTGLTVFSAAPTDISNDNSTGWYANDILAEVVANTGKDATGYALNGTEYNIATTFGPGQTFSRLKTWVICNQPTVTMVFKSANSQLIVSDFSEQSSASVSFLGLFDIGSVSETYHVHNVTQDSQAGTVTVTMAPPVASGTIPLNQQVAFVLGGVASYPPNNI